MLTVLFKAFLGVTLSLSPLILIYSIVEPIFRKQYVPRLSYWVWMIFALRLLISIPFYGDSPLVLSAGEAVFFLDQDPSIAARAFAEIESVKLPGGVAIPSGLVGISWMGIAAMVWIAGATLFFLFHLFAHIQMRCQLDRWSTPVQDPAVTDLFKQNQRILEISHPIGLFTCITIASPMLVGFFRPKIFVPHLDIPKQQLDSIFKHELMHYKRRDLWYKLLLMTSLALHWYNPLVYLLVWRAENAMEISCDDDVLNSIGVSRMEYGLAILSQIQPSQVKSIMLSTQFFGGEKHMKIRIKQIADPACKKNGRIVLAMCAAFVIAGSLLIGCAPLSAGVFQKTTPTQATPSQETSIETTAPEVKAGTEGIEMVDNAPLESASGNAEMQSESEAEVLYIFERIASESQSQYVGGTMVWPAPEAGRIITPYGWIFNGQNFHTGIDIGGKEVYGTPVVAAQDGTIAFIKASNEPVTAYGLYIILDHGGTVATLYGHLSEILVSEGEYVLKGQQVGKIGATGAATGPHLHFEVRESGKYVDPSAYLLSEEERKAA
ncbi:MAG TPA: M23/M56 family metallopeptidase [Clostridia bacterium]|nr:M23/M56 family metallopeptidase [Clostridia bacterium]